MKNTIEITATRVLWALVIILLVSACSNNPEATDSPATVTLLYLKGADLSYVNELEDNGVTYTEDNQTKDVYSIMQSHGANIVRLRLWHNPTWTNYSTLKDVKRSIRRAKALNMYVLLDFHYSDTWTDPSNNTVPAAWLSVVDNTKLLADSLSNYTTSVLTQLKNENLLPDLVQIGNETNGNIMVRSNSELWPVNWSRNITLFNAGINAVKTFNKTFNKDVKTVLHVALNADGVRTWMAELTANNIADFDILGLSYYPKWQDYTTTELGKLVSDIKATYNKQILIVETGHIWTKKWNDNYSNIMSEVATGYPDAPCAQLQKDFLIELDKAVEENGGAGVIVWEPAWVSASNVTPWGTGSSWENVTFFDFSNKLMKPGGIEFLSDNNVAVTFRVDMSGVSTSNGVFITGEFTADGDGNWQLFPMKREGTASVYSFKTYLNPDQIGAYYYLNDDDWNARESVPQDCQGKWTDRLYSISSTTTSSVSYNNVWGSCATY